MSNAALILQLLILGTEQIQKFQQILATAAAENRDVTDDELNQASADYSATHAQADSIIAGK